MWAPCPFHQEKSASFHVDDRKGYYYCFGCHAKGDALSFVRETENVSFMEAVEILAREAGMQMPARDPMAQEKADLRTELANVMVYSGLLGQAIDLPMDGAAWEAKLNELIANSTHEKKTIEVSNEDFTASFRK